jgi:hypothetical protein
MSRRMQKQHGKTEIPFRVKPCSNNPSRWYVYFDRSIPWDMDRIKTRLEHLDYQVLTTTPRIMVFRSPQVRLTCHSYGFIQVDVYDTREGGSLSTKGKIITFILATFFYK